MSEISEEKKEETIRNTAQEFRDSVEGFQLRVDADLDLLKQASEVIERQSEDLMHQISRFHEEVVRAERQLTARDNILITDQLIAQRCAANKETRDAVRALISRFDRGSLAGELSGKDILQQMWSSSSSYWLSDAYYALQARLVQDEEVYDICIQQAMLKNREKTALFFTLLFLRFGIETDAREWLLRYLDGLDPQMVDSHGRILLEAYMNGVFGTVEQAEERLAACAYESRDRLREGFVSHLAATPAPSPFPYQEMADHTQNAEHHIRLYQEYKGYQRLWDRLQNASVQENSQMEGAFSKLLKETELLKLIDEPDGEEKEIIARRQYYQRVLDAHGQEIEEAKEESGTETFADVCLSMMENPASERKALRLCAATLSDALEKAEHYSENFVIDYDGFTAAVSPGEESEKEQQHKDVLAAAAKKDRADEYETAFSRNNMIWMAIAVGTMFLWAIRPVFMLVTLVPLGWLFWTYLRLFKEDTKRPTAEVAEAVLKEINEYCIEMTQMQGYKEEAQSMLERMQV
ncbi:MAG: hypothetical protein IKD69_14870 [Solobacterium sp.]|nr:hypothetical protein [Solobacterium sp.]